MRTHFGPFTEVVRRIPRVLRGKCGRSWGDDASFEARIADSGSHNGISFSLRKLRFWRGRNAPNTVIDQSSNLVPAVSAHTVASNTPFGSKTLTVADPVLAFPVESTVVSPAMIVQPVKTFRELNVKNLK